MNTTDKKSSPNGYHIRSILSFLFALTWLFPSNLFANSKSFSDNNNFSQVNASPDHKQKKQSHQIPLEQPLRSVDQKPQFKGGSSAMMKFITSKLNYPLSAKNSRFEGTVNVQFVVEKTGKITRAKVLRGFDNACDEEALRLVSSMPNWIPGRMNGHPVSSIFQIPIKFELPSSINDHPEKYEGFPTYPYRESHDKNRPLLVVEENPEFKGGYEAMINYLKNKLIYPAKAKKEGIQGTVFVAFVVERNGNITNVRILRGIGGGCDEEALRVVKEMPKWIPGKNEGKIVRVMFQIPIKFQLP